MSTVTLSEKMLRFVEELGVPENPLQNERYHQLIEMDFPTTKNEYWKYTRLGKIQNSKFTKSNPHQISKVDFEKAVEKNILSSEYIIIENGIIRDDLSNYTNAVFKLSTIDPNNAQLTKNIRFLSDQNQLFNALNATYFDQLVCIDITEKSQSEKPLQLIFISSKSNFISNPKIQITAKKFSDSKIISTFISLQSENSFTNSVVEFYIEENARLIYNKVQNENATAFHVSTEQVTQQKESFFKLNTAILDGALVRNNITVAVQGEHTETHMNGVITAKANQLIDNHTFVDHQVPNCFSNENYKYILDDKSTGVFNGKVIVQKDAQKINAYQKNANILLSDFAQINSKPELEIYADDVKCSHGSTTGQLDEDALFYLQARGIDKEKAKKMLVTAFLGDLLSEFSTKGERELIESILKEKHNWS